MGLKQQLRGEYCYEMEVIMGCRICEVMDVVIRATTEVLQCFNLTKMDNHLYDAPSDASQKTNA